jgi:hypothetical protein
MRRTRFTALIAAASLLAVRATPLSAWGSQGHQYIGNLAYKLLNPNARIHVRGLLGPGVDLGHAAVWPDCARSVEGSNVSHLSYNEHDPYAPKVCDDFGATERQRMVAYASRNWTQCPYKGALSECHKSYHFADVNVREHQDYNRSYFGTEDYDVVQAIKAATAVLKCKTGQACPPNPPFDIESKREALFMLAHFVGDVHQPLHVGAIYLDQNNQADGDSGSPTAGGNLLLLSQGGGNLHHDWDTILKSIGTTPSPAAIDSGCQIAPLPDPTPEPPEEWASESVVAANAAYSNMTFVVDPNDAGHWDIQFSNRPEYLSAMRSVQAKQLIVAGARLAAQLNSIWPSTKVATACK